MILLYLNPLPVKANRWAYTWTRCAAVNRFRPGDVGFIGAPWQLVPPSVGAYPPWILTEVGTISDNGWDEALKIEVPAKLCEQIEHSQETGLDLLRAQALVGFPAYRDWLFEKLASIQKQYPIDAIVAFLNCKSLQDAAGHLGIPVIHDEAGSIRQPAFKYAGKLFDFRGAHGNSEFEQRFRACGPGLTSIDGPAFIERYGSDATKREFSEHSDPAYEVGVALQVEDDSNIVAYNNNWNSLRLLYKARQVFPSHQILVRPHPLSFFTMGDLKERDLGILDNSSSAMEFVCKCKRILTINSSVAFEAIVAGKSAYILGDSAIYSMSHYQSDKTLKDEQCCVPNLPEKIGFYAFNYLMPRSLWMDPDYYRFRLSEPSEVDIQNVHLAEIERSYGISRIVG